MPVWNRFVWEQPVGLPVGGSIIINDEAAKTVSRAVTIKPSCRNAYQIMLSEESDFSDKTDDDWQTMTREIAFTLSATDETKTVYARFRNPGEYIFPNLAAGDSLVSASIVLDSDIDEGIQASLLDQIIAILRADTTLKARDTDWSSTDDPHVLPGWQGKDPKMGGHRSVPRFPLVEVAIGPTGVSKTGTYWTLDCHFLIRAWLTHTVDTDDVDREKAVSYFLWDVWEALNAYRKLQNDVSVLEHYPASFDPRIIIGGSASCGEMDYLVRVGVVLQAD